MKSQSKYLQYSLQLLTILAITTLSAGQGNDSEQARKLINLDYPGGSSGEYIEAVRKAAGDINVIIASPEAIELSMQPVRLRRVSVRSAMRLLNDLRFEDENRIIELHLEEQNRSRPDEMMIFRLFADTGSKHLGRTIHATSRVWTVENLLECELSAEDLLTAIETALELLADNYEQAQLRFHQQTGLIIARGHPEQMQAIEEVIDHLQHAKARRDAASHARNDIFNPAEEIEQLNAHLEASGTELNQMLQERVMFETRHDLLAQEIDSLRQQLAQRDEEIHHLRNQLQEMERVLQEKDR